MGNEQATLRDKNTNILQNPRYVEISARHNQKVLQKNLKTQNEFNFILESIAVRCAYLKYQWAQTLKNTIKYYKQALYKDYCHSYKQNLLRKSAIKRFFYVRKIDKIFFDTFELESKKMLENAINLDKLQEMFQEAKCFFMVENWFRIQLPYQFSLKKKTQLESVKQNICSDVEPLPPKNSNSSRVVENEIQEKIQSIMMKLTASYFLQNLQSLQLQNRIKQKCFLLDKTNQIFTSDQLYLVKLIFRERKFKMREKYVYELLEIILETNQQQSNQVGNGMEAKIYKIIQILGIVNVYSVLKVLMELGDPAKTQILEIYFGCVEKIIIGVKSEKLIIKEKNSVENNFVQENVWSVKTN